LTEYAQARESNLTAQKITTGFRILALGEVLWDLLPSGKQLGGAPANFAHHAHALGAEVHLVSSVGNDPLGVEILDRLRSHGMSADCVSVDPVAPTGTVSVEVSADGQPQFTIHEDVAWDRIPANTASLEHAARAQAVCFGSLAQRREPSRSSIRRLVEAAPARALRVFDINIRQHFHSPAVIETSLRMANVLKLNEQELSLLGAMFDLRGDSRGQAEALARRFRLISVALTRGADGALLLADGVWSDHPGCQAEVVDSVGAGDAFAAAMTLGLLAGRPSEDINRSANEIASHVCSHSGAGWGIRGR
jgi:fructokinase